ncbi:hypothetical protein [Streptomyces sannanensis]|uniref:hypothetical protein n=1 Tax=Streptomyces sannanensis TaxID=285536 RepID=UPI0031E7226A
MVEAEEIEALPTSGEGCSRIPSLSSTFAANCLSISARCLVGDRTTKSSQYLARALRQRSAPPLLGSDGVKSSMAAFERPRAASSTM